MSTAAASRRPLARVAARRPHRTMPAFARHPGDAVRVSLALLILAVTVVAVRRDQLSLFERDLFRLVNDLPDAIAPVVVTIMQGGNLVAGPLAAAGVAFVARARRMALDLLIAGPSAWFLARIVKGLVERPRPDGFFDDLVRQETTGGLGFVSGHAAVAAALATVAAPYLPRRARRIVWALALLVGFARIYTGAHLPLDVVGGAALGWGIGALVHLALGAPRSEPTPAAVARLLARAGLQVTDVAPAGGRARGSIPFTAVGPDGEGLFAKVLDPDPRDRDITYRAARFLAWRDVRDEAEAGDAVARAEHEAAMAMLAAAAGCRTPAVRRVRGTRSLAVLVQDLVDGPSLDDLPDGSVDAATLAATWQQVARLHAAGLAHRDLVAANVVVDRSGRPWLVDLAHALSGAGRAVRDNDVAELLASTALLVGPAAAVGAAAGVLPAERLARALPELQPLALTAGTRTALARRPGLLGELRATLADAAGVALRPPRPLPRVRPGRALRTVAWGLIGAAALVVAAGPPAVVDQLATPGYRWLGVAVLAVGTAALLRGVAVAAATGRRLGVGRMALVNLASTTAAALAGRPAAEDVVLRSLERAGLSSRDAAQATARERGVRHAVSAVVVTGALVAAAVADTAWRVPPHWLPGLVVVAVLAIAGGRRWVVPSGGDLARIARVPGSSMAILLLGATAALLVGALASVAVVEAVGGGAPLGAVVAVTVAVGWFGAVAPTAGAPGAAEVLLGLGLAATGLPMAAAATAALAYRLVSHWAPLLLGVALTSTLDRRLVI